MARASSSETLILLAPACEMSRWNILKRSQNLFKHLSNATGLLRFDLCDKPQRDLELAHCPVLAREPDPELRTYALVIIRVDNVSGCNLTVWAPLMRVSA